MATSGTTNFFPEIHEIVEEAYEIAGREMRSGYELRSAIRSLDFLLIEWANRGYNLWTIEEKTLSTVSGTATYTLDADTVDVIEVTVTESSSDYPLDRISGTEYMSTVNKTSEGRPTQYWVDRQASAPRLTLYLTPDKVYTVKYWRLRRMEDIGEASNTPDVPFRFLPALVAGLAFKLSMKIPESVNRIPFLEAAYERQWNMAADEDREKDSLHIRVGPRRH